MMGSLDPLGMPLATDVLSGERADDGLDMPIIDRIRAGLSKSGLLFVGDCKMSALDTRGHYGDNNETPTMPATCLAEHHFLANPATR
jgi:transposase